MKVTQEGVSCLHPVCVAKHFSDGIDGMQIEEAPNDEAAQHKDKDMGFNENGTGASPAGPLAALFNREVRTVRIILKIPSKTR